jgi:hypothetical protein
MLTHRRWVVLRIVAIRNRGRDRRASPMASGHRPGLPDCRAQSAPNGIQGSDTYPERTHTQEVARMRERRGCAKVNPCRDDRDVERRRVQQFGRGVARVTRRSFTLLRARHRFSGTCRSSLPGSELAHTASQTGGEESNHVIHPQGPQGAPGTSVVPPYQAYVGELAAASPEKSDSRDVHWLLVRRFWPRHLLQVLEGRCLSNLNFSHNHHSRRDDSSVRGRSTRDASWLPIQCWMGADPCARFRASAERARRKSFAAAISRRSEFPHRASPAGIPGSFRRNVAG